MRNVKYFLATALVLGIAVLGVTTADAKKDEKKDDVKYTIKKVMQVAHGKDVGLLKKAKDGTITPDEKKELVAAYVALGDLKPSKGDPEGWKAFTDKIVKAAKEYGDGKDEKAAKLTKALACMDCHKMYK